MDERPRDLAGPRLCRPDQPQRGSIGGAAAGRDDTAAVLNLSPQHDLETLHGRDAKTEGKKTFSASSRLGVFVLRSGCPRRHGQGAFVPAGHLLLPSFVGISLVALVGCRYLWRTREPGA